MTVLIVDCGIGNLGSVARSIEECGGLPLVSTNPDDVAVAERIILPGVGAFAAGMESLRRTGWDRAVVEAATALKLPVLGICLGMQLLAEQGEEDGDNDGLGLIPGRVVGLQAALESERIPHVGWNEVYPVGAPALFRGIATGVDFYFVHSFHFVPTHAENTASTTPYCGEFVSAVTSKNVHGVQFHPEKSSRVGRQLLQNFLSL